MSDTKILQLHLNLMATLCSQKLSLKFLLHSERLVKIVSENLKLRLQHVNQLTLFDFLILHICG